MRIPNYLAGLAAVAAAAGLSGPAAAAENPVYIGGGAAIQSVTGHDDGIAPVFRLGAKLDQVAPGFGVEGEMTHSLIDPESEGGNRDVTITTLGGYATYTVPLPNRRVALRSRLGLLVAESDPEGAGDDTEMEVSWGLGGEYRLSSELTAFVDYTRIESDVGHLTGGVQVHF